ncbi:MAG: PqqD family protein [Candidatus Omnitrophica bacterium]|nr:PqqD family protein [Candidatus Omnitrophota bacterium]
MELKINLDDIYAPSEDVVARDIQGEFILVPVTSGIGDLEDEIFSLNETGRVIWEKMDGKKTLRAIAKELAYVYAASQKEIEEDILGITKELFNRKMIVEAKPKK